MYTSTLMTILALTATSLASPSSLAARDGPGVYICQGSNWYGDCTWTPVNDGQCYPYGMSAGASFGPDRGLDCTVFESGDCDESNLVGGIRFPGYPDASQYEELKYSGFPDGGQSFKCTRS